MGIFATIFIFIILFMLGLSGYCYSWAKEQEKKSEELRKYPLVEGR